MLALALWGCRPPAPPGTEVVRSLSEGALWNCDVDGTPLVLEPDGTLWTRNGTLSVPPGARWLRGNADTISVMYPGEVLRLSRADPARRQVEPLPPGEWSTWRGEPRVEALFSPGAVATRTATGGWEKKSTPELTSFTLAGDWTFASGASGLSWCRGDACVPPQRGIDFVGSTLRDGPIVALRATPGVELPDDFRFLRAPTGVVATDAVAAGGFDLIVLAHRLPGASLYRVQRDTWTLVWASHPEACAAEDASCAEVREIRGFCAVDGGVEAYAVSRAAHAWVRVSLP